MAYDANGRYLSHSGVKGMKWGVRKAVKLEAKAKRASSKASADKLSAKAKKVREKGDTKFAKAAFSTKERVKAYNEAADKMNNGGLTKLNAKYEKYDLTKNKKMADKYYREASDEFAKHMTTAINRNLGVSPTGYTIKVDYDVLSGNLLGTVSFVKEKDVQHEDVLNIVCKTKRNALGLITEVMNPLDDQLEHMDIPMDYLMHSGVKGMKWGVRKSRRERAVDREKIRSVIADHKSKEYSETARKLRKNTGVKGVLAKSRARDFERASKAQKEASKKHAKRAELHKKISDIETGGRSQDRGDSRNDRRVTPERTPHYKNVFSSTAGKIALAAATTMAVKMTAPTAEMYGKRFAEYLATVAAEKAVKKAAGL